MKDPYSRGAYTSRRTAQFNISFGKGSQFLFTRHIDTTHVTKGLVYFNTTGSPISYASGGSGKSVRLDVYPDGGKWNNKTTVPIGRIIRAFYIRLIQLVQGNLLHLFEYMAIFIYLQEQFIY